MSWLGEAYLRTGHVEAALREAGRALDIARKQKIEGDRGWALLLRAQVHTSANEQRGIAGAGL